MHDHLIITIYAYLKTKKFTWVFKNKAGGSFSNSGHQKSLKACAKHAASNLLNEKNDLPVKVRTVYGFTESDESIESEYETTLGELLK